MGSGQLRILLLLLIQYLWLIVFLYFHHSSIETVKINDSRNNEYTYLRFDIPNSKVGPVSDSRLRSKMVKVSDMSPGEREDKEYVIKTILNSVN